MIPKEAIEAAANAMYAHRESDAELNGAILISPPADEYECCAQAALEAAAPYLRAQALEDAAEALNESADVAVRSWGGKRLSATASTSVNTTRHDARMLRARAVTERGQLD